MSAIVCHTALAIIGPRRLIFPCDGSHSDGLNRFTLGDNEHCSLSSCTATRIYSGCIIMRLDESAMKYKLMMKMVTFTNHHIRGWLQKLHTSQQVEKAKICISPTVTKQEPEKTGSS